MTDHLVTREDYEDPEDTARREAENQQYEVAAAREAVNQQNTAARKAEAAAELEEKEHFHAAFHVVMNQLVDDAEDHEIIDYVGCMKVVMMLFSVAKKNGIVHDVINTHLDEIMSTLFTCEPEPEDAQ